MYRYPSVQVTRVNFRPLLPPGTLQKVNPQKVLRALQRQVVKKLRVKILASPLSHRARIALANGFEVRTGAHSITVIAKHPGFRPLLEGRQFRQMTWLVKATRPIPLLDKNGKLIFRNATPRSMENGSWYHPSRQPTTVIEKAREEAREVIKARLAKEFRKEVRKALARGAR